MIHVRLSGNAKCAKTVPIGKLKIQYQYIHTNTDGYRQHSSQSSCILNNPNNNNNLSNSRPVILSVQATLLTDPFP